MSIDHSGPCNALAGKRTYTVEEIAKILGIGVCFASRFLYEASVF